MFLSVRNQLIGAAAIISLLIASQSHAQEANEKKFSDFLLRIRIEALTEGTSTKVLDVALQGLSLDKQVLAAMEAQPEFNQTIHAYVGKHLTGGTIAKGRALAAKDALLLKRIEVQSGVSRAVILAIWALESNFGQSTGGANVLRSLASLACCGPNPVAAKQMHDEFLAALQIIQNGDNTPAQMTGSWAGAMGEVQFLPSSFLKYAIDEDGDGKRDIWKNEADSLGSIGNFLRLSGWVRGQSWGYSVILPQDFDYKQITANSNKLCTNWAKLGVARRDGKPLPAKAKCSLFLPAGASGPAYLITENYWVIKTYNVSDSYALAVGLLADNIGGTAMKENWPYNDSLPDRTRIASLQRKLKAQGYKMDIIDGKVGPDLRTSIRAWQAYHNVLADGYPSVDLVNTILKSAP